MCLVSSIYFAVATAVANSVCMAEKLLLLRPREISYIEHNIYTVYSAYYTQIMKSKFKKMTLTLPWRIFASTHFLWECSYLPFRIENLRCSAFYLKKLIVFITLWLHFVLSSPDQIATTKMLRNFIRLKTKHFMGKIFHTYFTSL